MAPQNVISAFIALEATIGTSAKPLDDQDLMVPMTLLDHHRVNGYLAWMCRQGREFLLNGQVEKAHRWLGFVQGALYATGTHSIYQLYCMNSEV